MEQKLKRLDTHAISAYDGLQNIAGKYDLEFTTLIQLLEDWGYAKAYNMEELTKSFGEKALEGRNRVNFLLGGAHSDAYKRMGRTYLLNLWKNFKEDWHCGSSYKDLNPKDFDKALNYIDGWCYQEH